METKDLYKRIREIEDEKYRLANKLKEAKVLNNFYLYNSCKKEISKLNAEVIPIKKELKGKSSIFDSLEYDSWKEPTYISNRRTRRANGIVDQIANGDLTFTRVNVGNITQEDINAILSDIG